jgi:hypothetical protein
MAKIHKYDPSTIQYIEQLNPKPHGLWISAVDRLVRQLKVNGNWGQLDRFWIFAAENQQNARVSLVNPSSTQITEAPSGGTLNWTALSGYTADGTNSYLNSNYNPSINAINYKQNNASFGVYCLNTPNHTVNRSAMGAFNNTTGEGDFFTLISTTNATNAGINSISSGTGPTTNSSKGYFAVSRTTSSSFNFIQNSISTSSGANTSEALTNNNFYICGTNTFGSGAGPKSSLYQLSMAFVGSGSINQLALYNAFQTFATTIGFAV